MPARSCVAARSASRPMSAPPPVHATTTSKAHSAGSGWRVSEPVVTAHPSPSRRSAAARAVRVRPMTSARRPAGLPTRPRARTTTVEVSDEAPVASPVSARTRRPARSACATSCSTAGPVAAAAAALRCARRSWPRISGSPSTGDSSPAAVRSRCRAASVPCRTSTTVASSSKGQPARRARRPSSSSSRRPASGPTAYASTRRHVLSTSASRAAAERASRAATGPTASLPMARRSRHRNGADVWETPTWTSWLTAGCRTASGRRAARNGRGARWAAGSS